MVGRALCLHDNVLPSGDAGRDRLRVLARATERGTVRLLDEVGVGAGMATAGEVERITAALDRAAADPEVLLSMPRIVQAWGRKR